MRYESIPVQVPGSGVMGELTLYMLDNSEATDPNRRRPVVLLCPGGGYEHVSFREGEPIAMQFLAAGIQAAILHYSVAPAARYPEALLQLAWSVAYLRKNAGTLHIDPDKVIVQGCSAGGHLAASLGVFWNKLPFLSGRAGVEPYMVRPNALLLCYPVISSGEFTHRESIENLLGDRYEELVEEMSLENQVDADTPPAFLWHTGSDDTVPVENSILFYSALHWHKIPCELHIYPVGGHGISLATEESMRPDGFGVQKECQSWIRLAVDWLKTI